ncbi:Os03g0349400, partial [Oryza sativa Japonica Group]
MREVTRPSSLTTLGWWRRRRMRISRAMKRTLSGSRLSNRTFLSATILPVAVSRALYTLLYGGGSSYLVDLLEGVGAARGPAVDGLADDGGEPGGPAGRHLLPARPV